MKNWNSSQLQLDNYFLTEISVKANRLHDPTKEVNLRMSDIDITPVFLPHKDDNRKCQVTLRVQQELGTESNTPYYFTVEMVGFFTVQKTYPDKTVEWLVRTNGPSVLYSMVREILRSATAQGPFCPLMLPTVSFYTPETKMMLDQTKKAKELKAIDKIIGEAVQVDSDKK